MPTDHTQPGTPRANAANPGYATCGCGVQIEFVRRVGWIHAGETDCVHPEPLATHGSTTTGMPYSVTCTALNTVRGRPVHNGPCPVHGDDPSGAGHA